VAGRKYLREEALGDKHRKYLREEALGDKHTSGMAITVPPYQAFHYVLLFANRLWFCESEYTLSHHMRRYILVFAVLIMKRGGIQRNTCSGLRF